MKEMQIHTEAELAEVAQLVITAAQQKSNAEAVVVALSGDLGAGKTTLTQHLAKQLGVVESVVSPTYVIMKRYACAEDAPFFELVHIDAYRIETVDEMRVIRFSELLLQKGTIICIEWPEHIAALLPEDHVRVALIHKADERHITIS